MKETRLRSLRSESAHLKKGKTPASLLYSDIRYTTIREWPGKVLAKFPKPFSKIHSVTHSIIKVIFRVLQFSLSKSNLKSFYLSLKCGGWQRVLSPLFIAPGAEQKHRVFLPSPEVVL